MKNIKNLEVYKKCLIIVDMVNGFVREGVLHDEAIAHIIPRQIELIEEYKKNEELVMLIKDTHNLDSVEFRRFGEIPHCLKDTAESQLVDELKPYEKDDNVITIEKNSTSFMEAPQFREVIGKLINVERFDINGCCTDICVFNGPMALANYLDQWNRKAQVYVHTDAVATYNEENRKNYVDAAFLLMEQQGIQLVKKK